MNENIRLALTTTHSFSSIHPFPLLRLWKPISECGDISLIQQAHKMVAQEVIRAVQRLRQANMDDFLNTLKPYDISNPETLIDQINQDLEETINIGDPMKIETGQIVQVRYSMRHQFVDGKDDLYFVFKQEPVGTRGALMTYLRNTRTGNVLNICSADFLFMPLAPSPCP